MRQRQQEAKMSDESDTLYEQLHVDEISDKVAEYERLVHGFPKVLEGAKLLECEAEVRDLVSLGIHQDIDGTTVRVDSIKYLVIPDNDNDFFVDFISLVTRSHQRMPALIFLKRHRYLFRDFAS